VRRRFALAAILLVLGQSLWPASGASATDGPRYQAAEQTRTTTPIKHFIALMQENHSFDNYFGAYPGADGRPKNACVPADPAKPAGECVKPFPVGGKAVVDLGHNVDIYKAENNGGKMDGFISAFAQQPTAGKLAMGYYDDKDLPYYYNIADNYVLFDRFFTSAAGGSVWNHFYWVSGSPGNPKDDSLIPAGFDNVPTIFDRLDAAGISWKFYVQNFDPKVTFRNPGNGDRASQIVWCPLLNYNRYLDNPRLRSRIVPLNQYYDDLHNDTLPAVSFMVPAGASEHPPGSIQAGERFVRGLLNSLMSSQAWNSSAFTWSYDDWGGWYDHVRPPKVDKFGYGFRAPSLLVSPYAHKGKVDHTQLDFTSQLKFIEENWGVPALARRDAQANNLTSAFDFTRSPRKPVILSDTRSGAVTASPKTSVVYLSYGGAVALPIVLAALATAHRRRRGQWLGRGRTEAQ
jgi:phospholipase C